MICQHIPVKDGWNIFISVTIIIIIIIIISAISKEKYGSQERPWIFFLFYALLSRDNDLSHYLDITKIVFPW